MNDPTWVDRAGILGLDQGLDKGLGTRLRLLDFLRGLAYHAWSTPIELGYQLDPYQTLIAPGLFDGDMDESALPLGFTAQNPRHSGGIMFTLPTQILDQDNL